MSDDITKNIADIPYFKIIENVFSYHGPAVKMYCTGAILNSIDYFKLHNNPHKKILLSAARDIDYRIVYAIINRPGLLNLNSSIIVRSMETTINNIASQMPLGIINESDFQLLMIAAKIFDGKKNYEDIIKISNTVWRQGLTFNRAIKKIRGCGVIPRHIFMRNKSYFRIAKFNTTRSVNFAPFGVYENTTSTLPNIMQLLAIDE